MSTQTSDRLPGNRVHRNKNKTGALNSQPVSEIETKPGPTGNFARLQKLAGNRAVQRTIQRVPAQTNNTVPFEVDELTANQIDQARMGGQPLESSVRSNFEPALGYDLSSVKVHNSAADSEISQSVGAKAFTLGQDVFFKGGSYSPDSSDGKKLLAHELTHVVQQSSGDIGGSNKLSVNSPDDPFEHEADKVAQEIVSQQNSSSQNNTSSSNQLQRKEDEF